MAPTIRLRDGVNKRLKERFNCSTDTALAEVVGIDQSQWSRVTRGISSPGPTFQAQLLALDTGMTFDELFEVVAGEKAAR